MKTIERPWDWWAYRLRVRHRPTVPGIQAQDIKLIAALAEAMDLHPDTDTRVLDMACGSAVHALLLARRGAHVVGLDIAPSLMAYATEQARLQGLSDQARFIVGDMRRPPFQAAFDAVTILGTTFGLLDEAGNRAALAGAARALKPGGRLLLDLENPWLMMWQSRRTWSEFDGGVFLIESVFDFDTSTYHGQFRYIDAEGVMNTWPEGEALRIYTMPELRERLTDAGFSQVTTYDSSEVPLQPCDAGYANRLLVVATL
ncbi:MAG: methyltransferase domain-containing protein [Chloroflexi bacterium]|nr:methyltransferase domain-containing protein [Chloroflexota bacterium]MBU1746256.1 methyltransferase domain-containing protein [Chloroflexota bacterium]MBU1879173.1 methyltransferase domain-containing protein [Chloroflexota bacterium]